MSIKFGTGGFRGIIGDDFTTDNVRLIAQALSNIIIKDNKQKLVVIGYDHRRFSYEASQWMAEVFAANGISVKLLNSPSPSPTVMYLVKELGIDYGAMITASHNPSNFNGVKVFEKGGYDADADFTSRLEKEMDLVSTINIAVLSESVESKIVEYIDGINPYTDNILKFLNEKIDKDLKLAFDNIHGVGIISINNIFKKLDYNKCILLNDKRDPYFGGKMPNPIEANLDELKKVVVDNKLDFGFAMDSDGDRLAIIDENGKYVSSNEILAVIYYYLIKYRGLKGDIIKNCATSNLIDKVALKLGYKCIEVDVGFKNITHAMHVNDALIGGESSGGLTVRNYIHGKDSTFAVMLFINMVSEIKKPVSEIIKELHEFANFNHYCLESFIDYNKAHEKEIIKFLETHRPKFNLPLKDYQHYTRNFKFIFEDDQWILIRLSGTEPVFRIFSEMKDLTMAQDDIKRLNLYVEEIENDLQTRDR